VNRLAVLVASYAIAASCVRAPVMPVQPAPHVAAPPTAVPNDVIFAIDMSKSMMETDVPPNRLEATKLALQRFVANDKVDRIGVVVFSQQGKRLAALSTRADQLERAIARLRIGDIPELGTGIGDGLAAALSELRSGNAKRQTVILISDGDYNWVTRFDPDQATAAAKAARVVVHTVLLGRDGPGGTPTTNPSLMRRIAVATDGTFYQAPDAAAVDRALDDIQTKLRGAALANVPR
jgi:Ca-activated chloride channel family protein